MIRTMSRFSRFLGAVALLLGVGCNADENRIPGDTKAGPVAPVFLFLDVRASRSTITAGDTKNPITITVQANFADTGAPVPNGTVVNLATTLGGFDGPGGAAALALPMSNGLGTASYFPPEAASGTARISASLDGVVDSLSITVKPAPTSGGGGTPTPAPVASTVTLQASPTSASETGGDENIALLAIVRDNVGDPFENGGVNFQTEVGTLASGGAVLLSDSNGQVGDTLTVTDAQLAAFPGASFTVTATLGIAGGSTSTTFEVTIVRGAEPSVADSVTIAASPTAVPENDGDGGLDELISVTAFIRDQNGAFLDGVDTQFGTELGSFENPGVIAVSANGGQATTTLRLSEAEMALFPNDTFEVTATIGVEGGTQTATVTITIIRP